MTTETPPIVGRLYMAAPRINYLIKMWAKKGISSPMRLAELLAPYLPANNLLVKKGFRRAQDI